MEQLEQWAQQAQAAQSKASHAFARLLSIAEHQDSGQARVLAHFIAATYSSVFKLDLFELRMLDVKLADDALACIDALRWGKADLHKLVPDGEERVQRLIREWNLRADER